MRKKIIYILKHNRFLLGCFNVMMICYLKLISLFVKQKKQQIIFASFGGRNFDDSPRALYDYICKDHFFDDYELIWCFINPDNFELPRGKKVQIDTFKFFKTLIQSRIWVSNSGMDRGIGFNRRNLIKIETWHGTPLKKICGEENTNSISKNNFNNKKKDIKTIRCSQSAYDQEIFSRIFNADKSAILLSDLPRNDKLLTYSQGDVEKIKNELNIDKDKKVILYTPTYREYLINDENDTYIAPPINLDYWTKILSDKFVLLIRAHYAVSASLNIKDNDFIKDVSNYRSLNDLYIISDLMISDYSSTFFDYSILDRPMFCFAYDYDEYKTKRGLYKELNEILPCTIDKDEISLINNILNINETNYTQVREFHLKYLPYAGKASNIVVARLKEKIMGDIK